VAVPVAAARPAVSVIRMLVIIQPRSAALAHMRGGDSDCRCRTQCVQEIGRKRAKILVKYDDAQSLSRGKDVTVPEGYERDFKACRRFLDEHAQ
jgi:hypothetical protein